MPHKQEVCVCNIFSRALDEMLSLELDMEPTVFCGGRMHEMTTDG